MAEARELVTGLTRHPDFFDDFKLMARNAGLIETPVIWIERNPEINASAHYQKPDGGFDSYFAIRINDGAIDNLSSQELNSVIAHELAHIALGHTTKRKLPEVFDHALQETFFPFRVFKLWRSRRREKAADLRGSVIAGGVEGAISRLSRTTVEAPPRKGFWGRIRDGFNKIFRRTHPTDQKRIEYLQRFAARNTEEIQDSRTNLDNLYGKLGTSFSQATFRSCGGEPSFDWMETSTRKSLFKIAAGMY